MKGKSQPSLYFSAYPLKAIIPSSGTNNNNQNQTPYLRSVLSGKSRSAGSRLKVLPLANPYALKQTLPQQVKPAKQIEASGDEWFHHYE